MTDQVDQIALKDENLYPDESVLKAVLGESYNGYVAMLTELETLGISIQWRYYQDGKAWLCKAERKKKTVLWISAWPGYLNATLYFPERGVPGLLQLDIDEARKKQITEVKHIGKLVPCSFEIRTGEELPDLLTVIRYKLTFK